MTQSTNGKKALGAAEIVRFLEDSGHRHVFGLPGSSMVAVLHQLQNSAIRYIPAIHESVTVAAADGYARVAGSAVALLYMVPGTANGLANLYNAWRDETSLIVLSSQQASHLRTKEGTVGEGDLVSMVEPFVRFSREISRGMPVRRWLDRARRAASGSPRGPAFLAIPEDVFEEPGPVPDERETVRAEGGAPDLSLVVAHLRQATNPLLVVGGQVRRHGGAKWVERLAEDHGFAVAYEPGFNDQLSIAPGHPNLVGNLVRPGGAAAEAAADVVLVVGARYIQEGHPRASEFFPTATFVGHVNADAAKLEETRVANWSCACDPGAFLRDLHATLEAPSPRLLERRRAGIAKARAAALPDGVFARALAAYDEAVRPLHDALDHGWVVDEAVMGSPAVVDALKGTDGRRYLAASGGSLGWGTGASVGVALASGEPVTCVLGDGALRFGLHGLWTAAAEMLPITFVILDNGGYGSTRYFERAYVERLGPAARPQRPSYLGMDLRIPRLGLPQLLGGFGIPSVTVHPGQDGRLELERAWQSATQGPNAVILSLPFGAEVS